MDRLLFNQLLQMHRDFVEQGREPTRWRLGGWAKDTLAEELGDLLYCTPIPNGVELMEDTLLGVPIEWVSDDDTIELLSPY